MTPMEKINGFKNANIVLPDRIIKGGLKIEGGRIASFGEGDFELSEDLYVAPGFIDEHIHGANGSDAMDATPEAIINISNSLLQEGVTSFLPTTMTMADEMILNALRNIRECANLEMLGAKIQGIHLEGPFISSRYPGAQDPKFIQAPSEMAMKRYVEASGHLIKEVTFAYEEDKDDEFLNYVLREGILPSNGHSDCPGKLLGEGARKGIRSITHLFNGQRPFNHREIGVVGEALVDDRLRVELIADFIHSSPEAVKLAFKSKNKGDIVLISDSTEGKYLAPGTYHLGGNKIYIRDGVARLENGTIAGSILRLDQALRNVRTIAPDYSMSDLINLVSKNPADNLRLQGVGQIKEGYAADFAILDRDFHVVMTIVDGVIRYRK